MLLKTQLIQIVTDQQEFAKDLGRRAWPRDFDYLRHSQSTEVSVITGPRRCGKSTLLAQLASQYHHHLILYLDFDDPRLSAWSDSNFDLLYQYWCERDSISTTTRGVIFFDEIQNAPSWERWVSYFSNKKKHKVFVTGSNSNLLSSELATHLTGRHISAEILQFSFKEIVRHEMPTLLSKDSFLPEERASLVNLFNKYLSLGGYPKIYLELEQRSLLAQYHQDILIKDIAVRKKVKNLKGLNEVAQILMRDNSQILNRSRLAKHLGIGQTRTISNYLRYFEECYLNFELKQFHPSLKRQARSLSKFYVSDPAMAVVVGLPLEQNLGSSLENLVFLQLRREGQELFYWASRNNNQVDFVVRQSGKIRRGYQVCWSLSDEETKKREFRSLVELYKEYQPEVLEVITADEEGEMVIDGVNILIRPYWKLALGQ